jgi:hypothetical protein
MITQGDIGTSDTLIAGNPKYSASMMVLSIRFRNSAAYVLTVSRYSKSADRTDILYQYTLAAGDTVLDASSYTLEKGDLLYARSSVSGTTYLLQSTP